jgi:CO/xanthine dehydrogenase FAD-binding subunit
MKNVIRAYHRPHDWGTLANLLEDNIVVSAPILISARPESIENRNIEAAIDLSEMGLDFIRKTDNDIQIGAMTTLQTMVESEVLQPVCSSALNNAALRTARYNLRNQAVISGVLFDQTGPGEIAIVLLVLDAEVILRKNESIRRLLFSDFLNSDRKLERGEIFTAIEFSANKPGKFGIDRVARTPQDQEIVASAVYLDCADQRIRSARIAVCGASSSWKRIDSSEKLLENQIYSTRLAEAAGKMAEETSLAATDLRGSAEYRKAMTGVLTRRAIINAWSHQ